MATHILSHPQHLALRGGKTSGVNRMALVVERLGLRQGLHGGKDRRSRDREGGGGGGGGGGAVGNLPRHGGEAIDTTEATASRTAQAAPPRFQSIHLPLADGQLRPRSPWAIRRF